MSSPPPYWWEPNQQAQRDNRKSVEVQQIQSALGGAPQVRVGVYPRGPPRGMQYMYAHGSLLARTSDIDAVTQALNGIPVAAGYTVTQELGGKISRIGLPATVDVNGQNLLFDQIKGQLPGRVMPDHIVHITPAGACPATEPELPGTTGPDPASAPSPPAPQPVSVLVIDTGFRQDVQQHATWMNNVGGDPEGGQADHYAGHGMFVAGILAGRAPTASIKVKNHLVRHGVVVESALAAALDSALNQNPHVINMSAGTTTADNTPPIALSVVNEKLLTKQTLLVAAAGNDQSATEMFWPAAFPNVISVGALDESGAQAGYSNFGQWVQVWARGSNVVNAYPKGAYHYAEPPYDPGDTVTFPNWLARWSGTSFAAPIVAGRIAAHLAEHGGTPQAAWTAVRGVSQPTGPGGRLVITP